MGKIIGDTACPSCRKAGGDSTGNHLILFEDGGAFCNRCGFQSNWKEKDIPFNEKKGITDEELTELLSDFSSCKEGAYPERGLTLDTTKRYGCKIGAHPTDRSKIGSYLLPFHNVSLAGEYSLTGYKVGLPKEFRKPTLPKYYCQGRVKDAVLFGEQLLPNKPFKKLFICEAPMDAMALYQAIKASWKGTKWETMEPNVVALPHGTGSAVAAINRSMNKVKMAEEVILIFDNDPAGREAVEKVKALLPTVKSVSLPAKDPNDMLLDGKGNELAKMAIFGYQTVKIDELVDISDVADQIIKKPEWGSPYPWPTLTRLTYGIRSEVIGIAAGVGVGKSEFKYQMIGHDLLETDLTVGVFDLEATVGRTGKAIIGKVKHLMLHKPDVEYDDAEILEAVQSVAGRVKLYNHKGVKDWEDIKAAIRHMVVVDGCKKIYFDNKTALVAHLNSSEANDKLNTIMADVASMTHELDFAFIYFAHLNPPKTGPSHERGGKVHESQLTGSRAMIKWSHYIIGLERNKDPDLPDYERNTTTVVLLKDREFGNVGKFRVFWNNETGDLVEMFS